MPALRISILIVLGIACQMMAGAADTQPMTLEQARESGRKKSSFLRQTNEPPKDTHAIPKANLTHFQKTIGPLLNQKCLACHGPKKSEGRLRVDKLDPNLLKGPDVERWREIYNALSKSEMPPEDAPGNALSDANRRNIVEWLADEMKKASIVRRNKATHSSFRRMTKYEYSYALQDLLGLPYSLASRLPPESVSEDGFKNSSDLLQMSAMQFQTYREIGLKALKRVTVHGKRPQPVTYIISMQDVMKGIASPDKSKKRRNRNRRRNRNGLHLFNKSTGREIPFSRRTWAPKPNGVAGETPAVSPVVLVLPRSNELKLNLDRFLPDEGTMRVRIRAGRSTMRADEFAGLRLIFSAHTSNNANFSQVISERDLPVTASADKPEDIVFDIPLGEIQRNPFRKLATKFPRRDEFLSIRNVSNAHHRGKPLHVLIDYIEITAPHYDQWPPRTHTDIFIKSQNKSDEKRYGREVLTRFLKRAWRRPATSQEVDQFMTLFAKYRPDFKTFEETMVEVLATVLATPEFLYLTQKLPAGRSKQSKTITDLELASRLSFFLWSSVPDKELLKLAEQGKLSTPTVLAAQVKRMLADSRSKRFSKHFVQQWLGLDGLHSVTHVRDNSLKLAMREEPIAFFDEVLKRNRSAMDFIHSDYAVLNERLARHYGIPGVYGPHFRKVPIKHQVNRGGILTGAAVLTMNSDGKDSHPLKRGIWLLERILHDPPPPPPPNVPEVDLTDPKIAKMTLKERIADHRNKAACFSCHSKIDPWGIAFENYDALGVYRTQIKKKPVDATSTLFNKQKLAGMNGLKRYLLADRQDQFASAMVQKMTAYALGRPLSFSDHADIHRLTVQFRKRGDRLGDLVKLIVSSELFHAK